VPVAAAANSQELLGEAVRREGRSVQFGAQHVLFVEGDLPERVFILESGWVILSVARDDSKEIVLGIAGPGDILGEVSIFDDRGRSATAVTLSPVIATVAPIATLRAAADDIALAREMIAVLIARLRNADRQRSEFATVPVQGRVARRLLELGDRFGEPVEEGVRIGLPLSQEQLANWCGASRESTVKALASLRALRIISTSRRSMVITDQAGLRRSAIGRA
jgi:CRP/FNR family cyclic AMP-dependent transcriptional regulator